MKTITILSEVKVTHCDRFGVDIRLFAYSHRLRNGYRLIHRPQVGRSEYQLRRRNAPNPEMNANIDHCRSEHQDCFAITEANTTLNPVQALLRSGVNASIVIHFQVYPTSGCDGHLQCRSERQHSYPLPGRLARSQISRTFIRLARAVRGQAREPVGAPAPVGGDL